MPEDKKYYIKFIWFYVNIDRDISLLVVFIFLETKGATRKNSEDPGMDVKPKLKRKLKKNPRNQNLYQKVNNSNYLMFKIANVTISYCKSLYCR